ncbi:MAG: ATP-binding protein [Candidatus Halichondribacter symbioticus]
MKPTVKPTSDRISVLPYLVFGGFIAALLSTAIFLPAPLNWVLPLIAITCFCAVLAGMLGLIRKTSTAIKTLFKRTLYHERPSHAAFTPALSDVDCLPIALLFLSKNGCILQSNTAAKHLLAIENDDPIRLSDLADDPGRSIAQWLDAAFHSKEPTKPEIVRAKRPDKDRFVQITLLKSNMRGEAELVAVLTDATQLKTLEAQFVQSQKMQAIGHLAGGIAHDFNNLLTAIIGYCDLLKERYQKKDVEYGDLMQISQNANRAAGLVRQLLAFSRKQNLEPKPVTVNEVLSNHIHLLHRLVGETIEIRLDYSKTLPDAFVDAQQLEQVIMNLVVNARDAMPNGGHIWMKTRCVTYENNTKRDDVDILSGQYVAIELTDEGTGMPKHVCDKIFEPFYTTKKTGEGTGLGLSTAYGIIKQTGGYIFVDSTVDQGTTFTLLLPVVQETAIVDPEPPPSKPPMISALAHKCVLVVEDEDSVRGFALRALRKEGVNILEASSGELAVEIVESGQHKIDIILSDIFMPGMKGPEWIQKARAACGDAHIVFMSGYIGDMSQACADQIENATFIQKPFHKDVLVEKLNDVLKGESE